MESLAHQPLEPIQMLWVRGNLSRLERLSVNSFLANGHPVHLYTYEPGANIPKGVQVKEAKEIVPANLAPLSPVAPFAGGSMGAFSDCFRYHLLHDLGGWWADMDIVCLRAWRFPEGPLTAATTEVGHGRVANTCVMRFPAKHPLMAACRSAFRTLDVRKANISQTGPILLQTKMTELGYDDLRTDPAVFCPVPWNAGWQLWRPLWRRFTLDEVKQRVRRPHLSMRFTANTVAVHLWHETWRSARMDKEQQLSRSCLYERLQRRWNR